MLFSLFSWLWLLQSPGQRGSQLHWFSVAPFRAPGDLFTGTEGWVWTERISISISMSREDCIRSLGTTEREWLVWREDVLEVAVTVAMAVDSFRVDGVDRNETDGDEEQFSETVERKDTEPRRSAPEDVECDGEKSSLWVPVSSSSILLAAFSVTGEEVDIAWYCLLFILLFIVLFIVLVTVSLTVSDGAVLFDRWLPSGGTVWWTCSLANCNNVLILRSWCNEEVDLDLAT